MSAKVIELSSYKKQEEGEEPFGAYQQLRELMVSLFGPLDHVPVEPAFEEVFEAKSEIVSG